MTQHVELNGKKLEPRELTYNEVEQVLSSLVDPETHLLEISNPDEPVPAQAVAMSVGVSLEDLKDLTPSQGKLLIEEVKQTNPFLCQTVETLGAAAIQMISTESMEEIQNLVNNEFNEQSEISEEQPAS